MTNIIYIILAAVVVLTPLTMLFLGRKHHDPSGGDSAIIFIVTLPVAIICGIIGLCVYYFSGNPLPFWAKIISWVIFTPIVLLLLFELGIALKEKRKK